MPILSTTKYNIESSITAAHLFTILFSSYFNRLNEDNKYTVVWKSEKIDNSLSPNWAPAKISMAALCNGDRYRPLKMEIFVWDSNGKHQTMGVVRKTVIVSCFLFGAVLLIGQLSIVFINTFSELITFPPRPV